MTVKVSVIDENHRHRWYHRRKNRDRKILKFLQDIVVPAIKNPSEDEDTSESYPWCFVFSEKELHKKNYYIGALAISKNCHKKNGICVLFSHLSYDRISEEFRKNLPITFWLARILATLQNDMTEKNKNTDISQWKNALQRHYTPALESFLIRKEYRFTSISETLLSNCHIFDNQIPVNGGVESMPWRNWPECVKSGNFIWLWRQSRHGRIIDSKKIPIPMDITNAHR